MIAQCRLPKTRSNLPKMCEWYTTCAARRYERAGSGIRRNQTENTKLPTTSPIHDVMASFSNLPRQLGHAAAWEEQCIDSVSFDTASLVAAPPALSVAHKTSFQLDSHLPGCWVARRGRARRDAQRTGRGCALYNTQPVSATAQVDCNSASWRCGSTSPP